jgi:hypothetical protein|tara:strand:- start:2201 stop:2407 length:207 start_codon:yes stop_codon:yes gene_type:complete
MSDSTHGGKGDRSRVKDSKNYGDNFDRIFNQQFKEVQNERKNKRNQRLNEIGMLKYLIETKDVDSSDT